MRISPFVTVSGLLLALTVSAVADDAPVAAVNVYPSEIKLTTQRDHQSLIVQAVFADGLTRDV
ncbi:MAG: hypothetical protein ABGZ17_20365, partial [Planctomycetaceae bacterium]